MTFQDWVRFWRPPLIELETINGQLACRISPRFLKLMAKVAACQEAKKKPLPMKQEGGQTMFEWYPEADSCATFNRKLMQGVGARYLGRGAFRSAYEYRDGKEKCVIRLSHSLRTREHILAEAKAWKHAKGSYRNLLLPVTEHDPKGVWSVSPKAEVTEIPEPIRWEIGEHINTKLGKQGVHAPDLHTGNVGIYQGRPVAIDYGFGVMQDYWTGDLLPGMRKR